MELSPHPLCPESSQVHQEHGVTPAAVAGQLRQVLRVCSWHLQGVHDVQVVLTGERTEVCAIISPRPSQPTHQIPQWRPMGSGLYLSQLDGQRHFEALHPHFHGQHVVVACGAPGAMGNTSCGDRGV